MSDGAKNRQEEIEDRKQWRTISRRTTTLTITYNNGARRLFWFEEPEGFRPEEGRLPAGVILHGPFRTEAEVKKHIPCCAVANRRRCNHCGLSQFGSHSPPSITLHCGPSIESRM